MIGVAFGKRQLLNRGVRGDWGGSVIGWWDFHTFCRYLWAFFRRKIGSVSVLVRRSFFRNCFCFSGGRDSGSARTGAVETQLFMVEPASKKIRFF